MNKFIYSCLISFFASAAGLSAQGIEFFHGNWDEAVLEAKKQNKLIFLDAYASWCGPCKRMQRDLFPQEKAGEFFNKHFINFKQDMEKGEGPQLKRKFPLSAYPTLFFISPDEEIVFKMRGAPRTVDALVGVGNQAVAKYDPSAKYRAKYEEGDRSFETVFNYVKLLNKMGESSVKVANEYLDEQEDVTAPQNLLFILEATTRTDSRIYDLLIGHRKQIEKISSPEMVEEKIIGAAWNTVDVAVQFESPFLLEQTQMKIKEALPKSSDRFTVESNLTFHREMGHADEYYDNARDLAKMDGSHEVLHELARDIVAHFPDHDKAMKQAQKWAEEAVKKTDYAGYKLTLARILHANGQREKALELINENLEELDRDSDEYREFKLLYNEIGSM